MKKCFICGLLPLIVIILSVILILSCGGGSRSQEFQVVFVALQMDTDAIDRFGNTISSSIPELTINGRSPLFTAMRMGTAIERGDPQMAMGSAMRFSAMLASGEVDLVIVNMQNAMNMAQGSAFLPLEAIFTESELSALEGRLLDFDILRPNEMDVQVPTGERTGYLGIDITGNEQMTAIFGGQQIGVFVITNTANRDLAIHLMRSLI